MYQTKEIITCEQKEIRQFTGDKDTMTNLKIKKSDVASELKEGFLPAGSPITKKGTVNTIGVFGLLLNEIDFRGIEDDETAQGAILIDGFVNKARIEKYTGKSVEPTVIEELKGQIKFL